MTATVANSSAYQFSRCVSPKRVSAPITHANWKQVLDKYQVDYVVENKGDPLPNLLATQPDWQLVYEDKTSVIFVRTVARS